MSRAILRGAVCQSCRHEVLRSFLAVSGVPMPRYAFAIRPTVTIRAFSAISPLRSDRSPTSQHPGITLSTPEESATESENNAPPSSHVPWYLQEEPPATEARPVVGDHIPEIPENSPEMLPVLLEYTYKDLGLDDLKLFDLRSLEVPAALGANVIMIIGTARSVKHLNVSADRLCRWLRSKYRLSPHADGLLGRKELKIKLRRKAKRARAAANAGTMIDEKDDGITTGWICVNAGVVDKDVVRAELSESGFEGFGQVDTGTSVVVQIFTEEKRADIDLESLWQGTLDRTERKRLQDESAEATSAALSPSSTGTESPFSNPGGQRRAVHTARQTADPSIQHTKWDLAAASNASSTIPNAPGHGMNTDSLLKMLVELPHDSARSELGTGPKDRTSTLFLQLLYASLPSNMPKPERAILRLRLFSIAIARQHPQYSKEALFQAFNDCLHDGHELSDELAFDIVAALLAPRLAEDNAQGPTTYLPAEDIDLALQVLDRLSLRGVPILNFKVFNMLYKVADTPNRPCSDRDLSEQTSRTTSGKEWTKPQQLMLSRISKIVAAADIPFDADEARLLMATQFRYGDYDGYWRLWHQLPLKGSHRTRDDYAQLFQLHADLGDERRARDCLSMWVPMMSREHAPIVLEGEIVTSLMHCLLVADPDIQNRAQDDSPSYFLEIWTQCQRALERENW